MITRTEKSFETHSQHFNLNVILYNINGINGQRCSVKQPLFTVSEKRLK